MKKLLIIDTENYVGDFYQELASYVMEGNDDLVEITTDFVNEKVYEDDLFPSCCEMWPTKGWFTDHNGEPVKEDAFSSNCDEYEKKYHTTLGTARYPAYLSLAIHLSRTPNKDEFNELGKRTYDFAKSRNITITWIEFVECL